MAKRTYKKQIRNRGSIIIPLLVTLILFLTAALLGVSYFDDFYLTEKNHEATLLAQAYANTLESTFDTRALLTEQLHSTLKIAGNILSAQKEPFTDKTLAELALLLNVDVLYIYDKDLRVQNSSNNKYHGWVAPMGHSVRNFHESGLDYQIEEIRADSESDTYWLYSYTRAWNGQIIQSGIQAEQLMELYEQLGEQRIIDQIAKKSPHAQIKFINPDNIVTASNLPAEIGQSVEEPVLTESSDKGVTKVAFGGTQFDRFLKLYLPIRVDGAQLGTLALLFNMANTNKLFIQILGTVIISLSILFILFSLSIISIAKKNRQIFEVAYFDEVTGLPNLRFLERTLGGQEHDNLALIIINPLHLKFINLIHGYSQGDKHLHQIAGVLGSISFKGISLQAYRFSDDRFILTVQNYGTEEMLHTICKRILTSNKESRVSGPIDLIIGVVEWHKDTSDFETIIKEASIALNTSEKANPIQFYTTEMEELILRKDAIENELKRVLAGETGILHLEYQPIFDAKDRCIHSFEALARMQSKTLGRVPPLEFIAIAEERHLIIPLGIIIFEHACAYIKELTDLGYGSYHIGVNVSALQLLDETFVETIGNIIAKAGIRAEQLVVELTESVFLKNFDLLSQQVEKMHAMGIRIAIDDFGTGFSSLSRLGDLKVDILKLDKQFIDRFVTASSIGISSDIISMGHHLGKKVIAEGVETEEQYQQLLKMGCNFIQGYLFSKPVRGEKTIALLTEERAGNLRILPLG